jgi:mannitol-1-/sugar-/sorbitol-6-/2-deoxyglucose-6-phosphatase
MSIPKQQKTSTQLAEKTTIIFDMDGVIIDSEPHWRNAQIDLLKQYGITITVADCIQHTMGKRIDAIATAWCDLHNLPTTAKELELQIQNRMVSLIEEQGQAMTGLYSLLEYLKQKQFQIGLATSSNYAIINAVMAKLDIRHFFDHICSADDEEYGKPNPAVYLTAAKKLGVTPQQCLVIEDSLTGLIAAKAATMMTFLVSHEHHHPKFTFADAHMNDLLDVIQTLNVV